MWPFHPKRKSNDKEHQYFTRQSGLKEFARSSPRSKSLFDVAFMSCTYSLYNSEGKQHHIYVIWIYHVDIVNTHCHESDTTLLDVAGRSTNSSLSEVTGCKKPDPL
ncbi:unnamed protein product [Clavelina lepadiformis]|uniref:Uncharacterized protein n=1 Tax=Clavelina lepadiformis TaxID=159417 RepID=A0ABP0GC22_CLALP